MIPFDLTAIEAVMKLMTEHRIDAYESPHFSLKKSQHQHVRSEPTAQELLQKHLEPLPDEPWNEIPQEEIDRRAIANSR